MSKTARTPYRRKRQKQSDGDEVTSAGRLFHTRAVATGNARSPTVDRHVTGTTSVIVDAERNPTAMFITVLFIKLQMQCIFLMKLKSE